MTSSVRLSVVTAVYNGEPYFDRAIPSILAQSFQDFEFIIIDDGSTDRTPELLREAERLDSRIRVLSPGRLGFVRALNYGVSLANGDYIARQDFDDISFPDRFTLQVDFLDRNPEIGVVGGSYVIEDRNRRERYVRQPPTRHGAIVRAMAKGIPLAHTCVMFRKAAWADAGRYPEVEDIEDLRLWIEIVRSGWKLSNLPDVIGEHLVHQDSYWHATFRYAYRQRRLQRVQWLAIRELELPFWMSVYPIGRFCYSILPARVKKLVRRSIGQSVERDLVTGE